MKFNEAGLAAGSKEAIETSADATTTYECVNNGSKEPEASNKTTTTSPVSKSGFFTADQNGNLEGSETLEPPSAASLGFSCPGGQTVTLVEVSYTNVIISDSTSGASDSLGGPFTYTNPAAPA